MRSQRKLAALLMSLSMVVTMPYTAFATEPTVTDSNPVSASSAERQGDVVQGVAVTENTLFQDSTPDAHYQATFTLDTSDFAKEVAKVEVGGNFQFYTEDQLDDYLANEDTIEPGTETLSITADPPSDGLVKARTGDTTDAGTYANWYKTVYTPTEEEPEETNGEDESV